MYARSYPRSSYPTSIRQSLLRQPVDQNIGPGISGDYRILPARTLPSPSSRMSEDCRFVPARQNSENLFSFLVWRPKNRVASETADHDTPNTIKALRIGMRNALIQSLIISPHDQLLSRKPAMTMRHTDKKRRLWLTTLFLLFLLHLSVFTAYRISKNAGLVRHHHRCFAPTRSR